jgi:hypothetical protein
MPFVAPEVVCAVLPMPPGTSSSVPLDGNTDSRQKTGYGNGQKCRPKPGVSVGHWPAGWQGDKCALTVPWHPENTGPYPRTSAGCGF